MRFLLQNLSFFLFFFGGGGSSMACHTSRSGVIRHPGPLLFRWGRWLGSHAKPAGAWVRLALPRHPFPGRLVHGLPFPSVSVRSVGQAPSAPGVGSCGSYLHSLSRGEVSGTNASKRKSWASLARSGFTWAGTWPASFRWHTCLSAFVIRGGVL